MQQKTLEILNQMKDIHAKTLSLSNQLSESAVPKLRAMSYEIGIFVATQNARIREIEQEIMSTEAVTQ